MGNNLLLVKVIFFVYDCNNLVLRIVYLGFGVFYSVYQGVYVDIFVMEYFSDWGYYEVNLIGGEQ